MFYFFIGKFLIFEFEFGFVIVVGLLFVDEIFKFMKDIILVIICEYGVGKINYGLVVFGDIVIIKIWFNDFIDINNFL